MKSKELLLKHLLLNDCKGYVTSDGRLYKAIIDSLEEAINYTHCCTELKDKTGYNNIDDFDPSWIHYINGNKKNL